MSQAGSTADSLQGPGKPPGTLSQVTQQPPPPPPPPQPRRSRAVACAECRRLKLKCDRTFPCMNCRRREVANLCPHGSLITRSRVSNAVVAEGSGKKHDVKWMLDRITRLEEALALVQSKVSEEPHPLLAPSSRPDGYASGSSEQPDSDALSPPASSSSIPQSTGQNPSKRIHYSDDIMPDKSRPHTDSAYR